MRILVTGAAGYIGSVLCGRLLAEGWRVYALDTFPRGDTALAALCANERFKPIRGDCRFLDRSKIVIEHMDFILPLAALVGAPLCEARSTEAIAVNTTAILDLLARHVGHRVIFPATDSGYGSQFGVCDETTEPSPLSIYAHTKWEAERSVLAEGGISLRLASVFGMSPKMRTDLMVNEFVLRAMRDRYLVLFEPHFVRNFVHVHDVCSAFIHAIKHRDTMAGQAYNVGNSSLTMTKMQLAERIAEAIPGTSIHLAGDRQDPDRRDCRVSCAKIEQTGWRAFHSLDDGITELVKGYEMLRDHRYRNA